MDAEDLKKIRKVSLFKDMADQQLYEIIGNEPVRMHEKGKILFQQGDEADYFYVILSGWVKIFRLLPWGEEAVLHILTTGESFAEAAMFDDHHYPATAEIVSDARLLAINCGRFENQLIENPKAAMRMLASTTKHLKTLVFEVEQLKGRNSVQRLAFFLYNLCPHDEVSAAIQLPYEKTLIAARIGIQPESLSRVLAKLRGVGVNSVKDRIVVSDVAALKRIANDEDALSNLKKQQL